jgi:hypothetical protein
MDALDRLIIADLSQPMAGPDLTASIMHRLGYEQKPRKAMTWRRLGTWGGRFSLAAAAVVALALGVHLHQSSPRVRRPVGPTIPAALESDLQRLERQGEDVLRGIRQLQPIRTVPGLPHEEPVDDEVDRSAAAPYTWV